MRVLGGSWVALGGSWAAALVQLGWLWAVWIGLGALLSGAVLGRSWTVLGGLGGLGAILGYLGTISSHLGTILGPRAFRYLCLF